MSFLTMPDLITFFNFLFILFMSLFTNMDDFPKSHECLSAEKLKKKNIKKNLDVASVDMEVSFKSCLKSRFFGALNLKMI